VDKKHWVGSDAFICSFDALTEMVRVLLRDCILKLDGD